MIRRPVVAVLDPIHPAAMERLAAAAEARGPDAPGDWRAEADGVIVRNSRVTAEDLARAPRLQVVGKHGVGLDNIDLPAAEAAGIAVCSAPGANADSVADLAIALALAAIRGVPDWTTALRAGRLIPGAARIGYELGELEAGIVGVGNIGRAVARRLTGGFGSTVAGYDPYLPEARWPAGVARAGSLRELLARSRIVFLHTPLTAETRGMIDEAALEAAPPGAFLINCARGGIVDEAALAAALRAGRLGGAASDVFAVERPRFESPLFGVDGFVATPHLGAQTERGLRRVGVSIVEQVLEALTAPEPPT